MGKSRRKERDKQVTSCEMEQGPSKDSRTASSQNKKEPSAALPEKENEGEDYSVLEKSKLRNLK